MVVIPMFAAVEEDAPRTEWARKMAVSTPASASSDLNHLAIELEVTALCGLTNDKSSLDSSALRGSVRSSYVPSVATGHRARSSLKEGKKNSVIGFPCRDCFDSACG